MSHLQDAVTLFPDTNALLHHRSVKEINWQALTGAANVKLVICLPVISELDHKKSDSRLGDRAKRCIKEIDDLRLPGTQVRSGVTLEVCNQPYRMADFPETLSPDSADDRIVHLVLKYVSEHPDEKVAVVTEDMGMRLRCEANSIRVVQPAESSRLESPRDEHQKKVLRLQEEVAQLRSRLPKLRIIARAEDQEQGDRCIIRLTRSCHPDIEAQVLKGRRRLLPTGPRLVEIEGRVTLAIPGASDSDLQYADEVESYLARYREWRLAKQEADDALAASFEFELEVSNSGTAPAKDVDLYLYFPSVVLRHMMCGKELVGTWPKVPAEPTPPVRRTAGQRAAAALESMVRQSFPWRGPPPIRDLANVLPFIPKRDWTSLKEGDEGSFVLRLHIESLKHHDFCLTFDGIEATFRSWEVARTFSVRYVITGSNLPQSIEGDIPFIVQVEQATPNVAGEAAS